MIGQGMVLLSFLLGGAFGPPAAAEPPATQVTYVANEGFLIESHGKKILVDALFHDETINWCHAPSAEMLAKLEGANPPFDGVDLILITHWHIDHFTPEVVLKHLASNPEGVLVGSPQVVSRLRAHESWAGKYEARVKPIDLDLHGSVELNIRGIRVRASRFRHGAYMITDEATGKSRNKHEEVENLIYLVETGGTEFMHFGDAFLKENQEYFDGKRFGKQPIDLVFLEGWSDETLATLREWMSPGHVIFMHMPPDPERIERLSGFLASKIDNAVVFREPMERRSF